MPSSSFSIGANCLYTTVKNVSGSERVFGYLGPRGKRLASNEVVTLPGDIVTILGGKSQDAKTKKFKALERSLAAGTLEIVSSPSQHLYDETDLVTKVIDADNGLLGLSDPCWA